MIDVVHKTKVEYGDFQTPLELAERVCQKLIELDVSPDAIVEPTCGVGNFIETAAHLFKSAYKIVGVEINSDYLQAFERKKIIQDKRVEIRHGDFFQFDWSSLIDHLNGKILVLGNFPWVTNSQQAIIGGANLPRKSNFQNHDGLDAITGKSNFDISEWMLIQAIHWLQNRDAYLAMLCLLLGKLQFVGFTRN
jgi:type I restriction-modification system DNA methylase subunit